MVILIQVLGLCAMISWVLSIQMKEKSTILELQILASLFYGVHYGLLDAMSAVGVTIISIIRLVTIYLIEKKGKEVPFYVFITFILMLVGVGIVTYTGPISLIPIVITMIYTYTTWQKNTKIIRGAFLVTGSMWIIYNFSVGSYLLMIGNLFEVISSVVSLLRFKNINGKNR